MAEVPLYGMRDGKKGQVISHTRVDDEWESWATQWRWNSVNGYAARWETVIPGRGGQRRCLYLHRELVGAMPYEQVDHINGDELDNRLSNLRIAVEAENRQNLSWRGYRGSTSRYRGVCWDKNRSKWMAKGKLDEVTHFIGRYDDELEAARAAAQWRAEHMTHSDREVLA